MGENMFLKKIISFPIKMVNIIFSRINPEKYACKIGVNCNPRDIKVYGKVFWGSEHWIIKLGKNVHITNNVSFVTHDGGTLLFRDVIPDLEITKPIEVGDNVYIGMNAIILPGVKIGNNVVIGVGSIVTKNLDDNCVFAGNPAKFVKSINDYKEKIEKESLHLGHLKGKIKDIALRKYYNAPLRKKYTWKIKRNNKIWRIK